MDSAQAIWNLLRKNASLGTAVVAGGAVLSSSGADTGTVFAAGRPTGQWWPSAGAPAAANPPIVDSSESANSLSPDSKPQQEQQSNSNPNPRTTASGFDPEALERGAKALRELNSSQHASKVFEIMRKQEETRQAEWKSKKSEYEAMQAQIETERQKVLYEEQRKNMQQQAQTKAQLARYEDELARKRMQADHEAQRVRNAELVKLQEEAGVRQEQVRRATEEEIQQKRRQTEAQMAEIERETLRVKAFAEAEARAHESKLSEEINRRMLLERANAEREKWLAAINATFQHIGGGVQSLLTDQNKMVALVGGTTALAAGIYTSREGSRVVWRYVERVLGQPSLIRESSRGAYPWSRFLQKRSDNLSSSRPPLAAGSPPQQFGEVVLNPDLLNRVSVLASSTANTKKHNAPFRNMMFYGPPGTGKTMAAKTLARNSGLDYAMMTGGDVAPLGTQAVTKLHEMFDWANRSRKGLLLFIDEADAFLAERNRTTMSEAQRSALNALLFRTGDQSNNFVLVLATNRPSDLDSAITDRIDEVLEFPLPGVEERLQLLKLYLKKYILDTNVNRSFLGWKLPSKSPIAVDGITDEVLRSVAERIQGFSGREIAKLLASVQSAAYGSHDCVLTLELLERVVSYKVEEHKQRLALANH